MKRHALLFLLLLTSLHCWSRDYVIENGSVADLPPCSGGIWLQSGSTFNCAGRVTLNAGDTLDVSTSPGELLTEATLSAQNGFELNSNSVGSTAKPVNLTSSYGSVIIRGTNTISGDIASSSGAIEINQADINGGITSYGTLLLVNSYVRDDVSAANGITFTDSQVDGSMTATSGGMTFNGGEVRGQVTSNCCVITADGTDFYDGVRSLSNSIYISSATIAGDFYAANNYAEFNNVTMTEGSITGASSLQISNSTIGSSAAEVTITTQSGAITLNDTRAYGDLTTPNWSSIIANGSSIIIGTCTPRSSPASACMATPPLTCISDSFGRSSLGSNWAVSRISGGYSPSIQSNRLLLTQDSTNQSTAATLQRLFPAQNNLIIVEFDHYAWSPWGGQGADGISLVFSDATVTPQAGSYGGSLGYAQRTDGNAGPGFAGGWLGIALDEYGNFSSASEGREGGPGFRSNSVAVRGSGVDYSGYRYITGAHNISPSIDYRWSWWGANPGYRYRISIDASSSSSAVLTVQRDTGSGFRQLIAPVDVSTASGQSAIPANLLFSLTGSTGSYSNNHAIDNLQVCANYIEPMNTPVHHFEFVYSSDALSCSAQDVLIRACANESCSSLYNGNVQMTLAPSGWEGGDTISFRGGETTEKLWNTDGGRVDIAVRSSQPLSTPYVANLCRKDGGAASTDCSLSFADSGFIVDAADFTAGKGITATLQAVKKDDASRQCVPAFASVRKDVYLWGSYINPSGSGRVASLPLLINGRDIAMSEAGATAGRLTFDSEGKATFDLNYYDAGLMQLNARYLGSGDDAGLQLDGSRQFASIPAGFCVQSSGECSKADATCDAFVAAGSIFPLNIQAVSWQRDGDSDMCQGNSPTPSYAQDGLALTTTIVSPADGNSGSVTPASYNHSSAADNVNSVSVSESEVGVFRFRVMPSTSYFGHTVPAGESQPTGRFYAHHFSASTVNPGALNAWCHGDQDFVYTGQAFDWLTAPRLQLTAQNAAGVTTQNYTLPGYQKLIAADVSVLAAAVDNSALDINSSPLAFNADLNSGALTVSAPGIMLYDLNPGDAFSYDKTAENKIAPFSPDIPFSLNAATDSDGAALISALTFQPLADFDVRYGRLWLENAYGPETLDLPVNIRNEYFDGNRFVLNTADSCWQYDAASDVTLSSANVTTVAGHAGQLSNGSGIGAILLMAPADVPGGIGNGEVDLTYDVPVWLQDDFDLDGSYENPQSTASFGIYRGNDRVIYWREIRGF